MRTAADAGPPVRVTHVVALIGDSGQFGGPTTVAVGDVRELTRRGRPTGFIALRIGQVAAPADIATSDWQTFPARQWVPAAGMLGLFNPRLLPALWRAAAHRGVVHVHAGRDLVSLTALVVAHLRRAPVVAQTHGMVQPRSGLVARAFDAVFLRLLRRARVVLFLTPDEEADLRRQLGPRARLRFLSNGLELPPRARPGSGPPRVVFASRLHPVKRVIAFAEVAERVVRAGVDAEFVVYGPDQGDLPALLQRVADPSLHGRLRYDGALDHRVLVEAVGRADVFVLPSSADWMPMSLLEAMGAGVATVCTSSCGLAPAILAADAGLVVDGSVDQLTDAVLSLLREPGLRSRLGAAGRSMVEDVFAIKPVADQLEVIYSEAFNPASTSATTRSSPL